MNSSITAKTVSVMLAVVMLLSGCASTTVIQSIPSGAKVYVDGETLGTTPYSYSDTKFTGSTNFLRLEKEGYEVFNTSFSRNEEADVGAIIGGFFVWVPFLWAMKYKPTHTYELSPIVEKQSEEISVNKNCSTKSKADRLRELKQLLDEEILTQEEYEKEKKKVLEE
jgi:uncharacterized protein YceK